MGSFSEQISNISNAPRAANNRTGRKPRLTMEDARKYIELVKNTFQDDREKYLNFMFVMKDFKEERINASEVISWVEASFEGHDNLIRGFNDYLPEGYEIKPSLPTAITESINFVNKIKARFQDNIQVFHTFLNILNQYRLEKKTVEVIYQEVHSLFEGNEDLLEDFKSFLPEMV